MDKKSLISSQIVIVLYLLAAAIAAIEASVHYKTGGFSHWQFYFFTAIFLFCAVMYFIRKKQRLQNKK